MLLVLPKNIRLGCKGLPETNTLAFLQKIVNNGHEKFNNIDPKCQCYKTFFVVIDAAQNKTKTKPFQPEKELHLGMLWTYPQMLDSSKKAIQGKHSSLFGLNVSDEEKNYIIDNCGLYYKQIL
jgi:hypothetical protein